MEKEEIALALTKKELIWLEEMTKTYEIPSLGKTIRIVINHVAQTVPEFTTTDKVEEKPEEIVQRKVLLARSQSEWLKSVGGQTRNVVRSLMRCASGATPDEVFSIKRCKSKTRPRLPHLKVLIILKGFGGGFDGPKMKCLTSSTSPRIEVIMPIVPEPSGENLAKGLRILHDAIERSRPDILIASSRGGIYASRLMKNESWKSGGVLCISALETAAICQATDCADHPFPVILCHGTKDDRVDIGAVRRHVLMSSVAELVEFDDGHDLNALVSSGRFVPLIKRLRERCSSSESRRKWAVERAKWIETGLRPKIEDAEREQREAMERARNRRRKMGGGGLLSALRKKGNKG